MEHFFTGATQAGRELQLFYEHTAFDHFTDHDGVEVSSPSETKIVGTLDGAPIEIEAVIEAANTLEMTDEQLRELYPDGTKALPPELQDRPTA